MNKTVKKVNLNIFIARIMVNFKYKDCLIYNRIIYTSNCSKRLIPNIPIINPCACWSYINSIWHKSKKGLFPNNLGKIFRNVYNFS